MKLYRCYHHAAHDGVVLSWHASKVAAVFGLAELVDNHGPAMGPSYVEAVEVPTDKPGLIAWLNSNFNADNG